MFTFQNQQQRARVCQIIEGWLHNTGFIHKLMVDDEPVESSWMMLRDGGYGLASPGQNTLLDLFQFVWNGSSEPCLGEFLEHLDDDLRAKTGELVYAMFRGHVAVDAWLRQQR
jgi:hypothetical protein